MSATARAIAVIGALAALVGLVVQFWQIDETMSAQGVDVLGVAWRFVGYFTILSNILVMLIWVRAAARPEIRAPRLEAAGAVAIVMVGVIYHLLLAARWQPQGWQLIADILHHTVTPVLFAAFWLLRPHGQLRWVDALWCVVWPLAYLFYALTRGAIDGWYAYYFLDPSHASPLQLSLSIAAQSAAFLACAFLFIAADKMAGKRALD